MAKKNSFVKSTLKHGWFPVITSMFISRFQLILSLYLKLEFKKEIYF